MELRGIESKQKGGDLERSKGIEHVVFIEVKPQTKFLDKPLPRFFRLA